MKHRLIIGILAGLILAGVMSILASAQASPNFDLRWNVLSGGGGQQSSANAVIQGTLGQTAPGSALIANSAGPLQLVAGFYGPDMLSFTVFLPNITR